MANAYLVAAPPQSYFIDAKGIVRLAPDRRDHRGRTSSASTRRSPVADGQAPCAGCDRARGRRERSGSDGLGERGLGEDRRLGQVLEDEDEALLRPVVAHDDAGRDDRQEPPERLLG